MWWFGGKENVRNGVIVTLHCTCTSYLQDKQKLCVWPYLDFLPWSWAAVELLLKSRANHLHIAQVICAEVNDHLASAVFVVIVVRDMWMVCVTLMTLTMWSLQCRLFQGRSLYISDTRSGMSNNNVNTACLARRDWKEKGKTSTHGLIFPKYRTAVLKVEIMRWV